MTARPSPVMPITLYLQLLVIHIEAATGLDFGDALRDADPLDPGGRELAPRRAVPINGPDDLVL